MFDFETTLSSADIHAATQQRDKRVYFASKRAFDIFVSLALLPLVVVCALALQILNPFLNKGPLLYRQPRMGRNCKAFMALKFRTMAPAKSIARKADDPLEVNRISPFAAILRKIRIDELPQVINVLRGDMSLIGPRPDYFHHARRFMRQVPGYRERHSVRPGISGLAQVRVGYVQGVEATRQKVRADLYYIQNAGFRLDTEIFFQTLKVVFTGKGI